MTRETRIAAVTAGLLAGVASVPVMAHHPMGGMVPATALEGLLSGFGHPVIEFFHLVFLVGFGMLLARSGLSFRQGLSIIAAFVVAGWLGVIAESVMALGAEIDMLVALTLMLLAAALWFARSLRGARLGATALAAGAAHGLAFGEAVIGAEPTPIAFYLAGLALAATAIAGCAMLAARRFEQRAPRLLRAGARVMALLAAASGTWMLAA